MAPGRQLRPQGPGLAGARATAPVCSGGRRRGSRHRPPARGEGAARAGGAGRGLQRGAERIVTKWGQGTSGGRGVGAAGTPGSAQHRQGAGRARVAQAPALPNRPGQQHGGSPTERGLCEGSLPAGAEPWAQGRGCSAPRTGAGAPVCTTGSHSCGAMCGQRAGSSAEAWPLLLLKGTGGVDRPSGQQGAGRRQRPRGAEGGRGTLCCRGAQGSDNPGSPSSWDAQQQPPAWGRGRSCQRRAKRDGARVGRCRAGDGAGRAVPGSPGRGWETVPADGEPWAAALWERTERGQSLGPLGLACPGPAVLGREEGGAGGLIKGHFGL